MQPTQQPNNSQQTEAESEPSQQQEIGSEPFSHKDPTLKMPEATSKRKRTLIIGVAVVLAIGAIGAVFLVLANKNKETKQNAQSTAAPHVKVGFMMAQSGGTASMGLGAIKGVNLAIQQLGIDNIEIVQADSKCDKTEVVGAMHKLIEQKVVAIIGEGCSSASVVALPLANAAKIPMISPSASSPALSIPNDYFFRTVPSDEFQARYLAEYAYKQGIRTVGEFHTIESAGTAFAQIYKETFERLGGKVVLVVDADSNFIDLDQQASQLAAAKPEAVNIFVNSMTSAVAMINLLHQKGWSGTYFGHDYLYDKTLIAQTGTASDGLTVSSFTLGTKAFRQAMANKYQSADLAYAAPQAYDALQAIAKAVDKGATTGEAIKNTLPSIEFDGVSGYHIKFDKNGEMSDPSSVKYALLKVTDGTFTEIEQ